MKKQPEQQPLGTVSDLGKKVKAKYPGVYDSLPDEEVGRKVKQKYPGAYDGFVDDVQPTQPAPMGKPEAPSPQAPSLEGGGGAAPMPWDTQLLTPQQPTEQDTVQAPMAKYQLAPEETVAPPAKATVSKSVHSELVDVSRERTQQAEERRTFNTLYGDKTLDEIKRVKEEYIPQQMKLLRGSEQVFLVDQKQLDEAVAKLEQRKIGMEQQIAENPSLAPQLQAEYEQEFNMLKGMDDELKKQYAQIEALRKKVELDSKLSGIREYELKSKQGNFVGATWNNMLSGVGSAVTGFNMPLINAVIALDPPKPREGETQDQANNRLRNSFRQAMRAVPEQIAGDEGTTKEYTSEMKESFLGGAWLSATESLPLMLLGPGGLGQMTKAADNVMQEMEGEEFANIPEWKKALFASSVGVVVGQLERVGLQQAVGGGTMARTILGNVFKKLPQNATNAQFQRLLAAETSSALANAGSRLGGAMLSEAATELQQGIAEPTMKELFNRAEEKNLLDVNKDYKKGFDTPASLSDLVGEAVYQAGQGAIGGAIFGSYNAVGSLFKTASVGKTANNVQYEVTEELLRDPEFERAMIEDLKMQVESGKLTEAKVADITATWKEAQKVVEQIPEDLKVETRKQAFDLLTEKAQLKKKDPALVGDRIAAIDAKLAELSGQKPEEVSEEAAPEVEVIEEAPATGRDTELDTEIAAVQQKEQQPKGTPEPDPVTMEWEGDAVQPKQPTTTADEGSTTDIQEPIVGSQQEGSNAQGAAIVSEPVSPTTTTDAERTTQQQPAEGTTDRPAAAQAPQDTGSPAGVPVEERPAVSDYYVQPKLTKDVSDDPVALASAYMEEDIMAKDGSSLDDQIGTLVRNNISEASFRQFGDVNKISKDMKRAYLRKDGGRELDDLAEEASSMSGTEVTPDDIVEYVYRNPWGRQTSDRSKELADRYYGITGKRMNSLVAKSILGGKNTKWKPDEKAIVDAAQAAQVDLSEISDDDINEFDSMSDDDIDMLFGPSQKKTLSQQKKERDEKAEQVQQAGEGRATGKVRGDEGAGTAQAAGTKGESPEGPVRPEGTPPSSGDTDLDAELWNLSNNDGPDVAFSRKADEAFNGTEEPKTPIGDTKTVMVDGKERTVFNSEGRPIHPTVEGVRNFWRWFKPQYRINTDLDGRPIEFYHGGVSSADSFSSPLWVTPNAKDAAGYADRTAWHESILEDEDYGMDYRTSDDYSPKYDVAPAGGQQVYPLYASSEKALDLTGYGNSSDINTMHRLLVRDGVIDQIDQDVIDEIGSELGTADKFSDADTVHPNWRIFEALDVYEQAKKRGYDTVRITDASVTGNSSPGLLVLSPSTQVKSATSNYGRFDPSNPDIREQKPSSTTKPPKTGRLRTDRVLKALSGLVPDLTIVAPKTEAEYAAAVEQVVDGAGSSWGMYDFKSKTLFINPAAPDLRQTFFHETAHPVIAALIDGNPEMFLKFYDEVIVEQGGKYEKYSEEQYADKDPLARAEEALAEFMGDIASGNVKVSLDPKSAWQKFKEFIQDLLAKLGWDMREVDLSKPQNVRQFAAEFARAVNKGIKITGLNPTKRSAETMLQDDAQRLVDGWYSRLRETVIAKGKTQPASEWLNWMQSRAKEGAFSMEEVKWTGLQDWLTGKGKEKVTPDQVREFLNENRVRVEVNELGGVSDNVRVQAEDDGTFSIYDGDEFVEVYDTREDAENNISNYNTVSSDTKFSQYQLPGGTNYREVLVTLPKTDPYAASQAEVDAISKKMIDLMEMPDTIELFRRAQDGDAVAKAEYDKRSEEYKSLRDRRDELVRKAQSGETGEVFKTGHFPDQDNILFHLRLNDRTDADGKKVLFIEEIQSDWAQKGRKEGFGGLDTWEKAKREGYKTKERDGEWGVYDFNGDQVSEGRTEQEAIDSFRSMETTRSEEAPPSAPFVTDTSAWVELAMKQAVRMAVDGGYDRVAWTKAQHHTDRWGTERIEWAKQPDGSFLVNAKSQHGGNAGGVDLEGEANARNLNPQNSKAVSSREQLEETIRPSLTEGQDAKKLSEKLWQRMQSEESGVSMPRKEGFEGFYDKIVPTVAAKVIKKMGGGKVGQVDVEVAKPGDTNKVPENTKWKSGYLFTEQPSFDITPEMRNQVGIGLAMMQAPDVTKIVNLFKSKGYTAAQAKEYMENTTPPVSKAVISAVVKGMGGVKSAPKKVQSNTNKATGVTKPKTKVTVNVATALKDQIRLEARAAREAKKDVSAKRKDFAERISEMIKNDLFGRIAPRQTNALITAAAKTNPDSPKAVDRFFAYAKRVISDANYAENLGNARDARNKARSLKGKKTIPANLKYVLARMAAVDVRLLEDPAEFAAMAEEFLASFKKPGTDQYNMASADAMNKYMDKLEKQLDKAAADEAMERGAEDISGIDGLDPDDVMKAMMSEDPEAELTKLLKDLDRRKEDELHDKMVAAANASRIDLKDMDTSAMTPKEKRAYKALVEADLQAMSIKDLASYIFGVDNLVVNESFDGIHSIAVAAAATKIVPEIGRLNEAAGFRTKWPIGRWDEGVRNAFRQMFYGLPNIVTRIAGFTKAAAKLSELVGIADIQKGRAMAEKIKHEEDVAFAKVLNEQIKKGRRNGRNVSGPKAVAAEGVIAYLVQRFDGVSDEESFKRRKDILEEDINKNAKDSPKTYKYIQQAFDEFVKDAKTAKEARDKFKAAMPENDVILQHMIDMQAKYADVIMEHNAMYRNQIDSKLQDYLPISYVMSRSASDDAKAQAKQKGDGGYKQDYSAFTRGLVNPRQAGHMKSRGQNKRLPENRRIDYNIRRNSLTTLAENLYDVYTTEHWMRARAVLRANGIDEALGSKDNTTALDNALADVYNSHTSDIVDDKMGGRYADYVAKKVKSAASFWGLAGAGQVLQQASDQMTNALLMSMTKDGGKSYGLSFMDVVQMAAGKNQDLKELLSMGAIGRRADTLSGTRWTKDMESQMGVLQSQIQRSAPLHALADIHRSMVRIFFTPLKETDNAMATSAWVMFYRQYLADNGIKRIGNWKDEVDLLKADDKLRREAFAHAEQQTNMTQGPSDPALFGAWARRDRSGWLNFVRAVLNPFGGFPSTVRGRFANAASEIGAYTIPAISDKKARERLAGAARVFASTVVSQGAFQYMRYKMAVALFPTLGAGLANMVRYFFDDEEDEVVAMSKLYVAMEIANTIGMMDRDFTRVVREANKQVRERNLLTPALYDEDAIMRKKAAENWKFSFTQFGIDMTVGGFSQYMDKEAVNGVNKAYWFMMGPVLQQPEMMQTDGTVIPYAKWKRDIVNMPFALPGYWDESTSYGLFSIPGSRMSRLMDAASRTGMPSDDERRDTQKRFKYQQRADDARSMRTQIQMRRAAKTDQEIEAADKAFEDWMRTQDPSRFERLSRTYLEQVIMPYDNSLGNILQAENDPIVRARTYHSATRNMSKEEKKKIDQSVQAVGVFDDAFMQELNRLQKEEAAKK